MFVSSSFVFGLWISNMTHYFLHEVKVPRVKKVTIPRYKKQILFQGEEAESPFSSGFLRLFPFWGSPYAFLNFSIFLSTLWKQHVLKILIMLPVYKDTHFWPRVYPGVLCNYPCQLVRPLVSWSVFEYLRDCPLFFIHFLHEVKAP